ncbi:MAG: P-loop NTPase, partial [Spirochaetes bacterium]|nr:P-loop NTPase [Spirochaetota bacterium]
MNKKIVIASGKGGTGKTFVSTNLAKIAATNHYPVNYLDCDVEEPNGHLFLNPDISYQKEIILHSPSEVDRNKCVLCNKCVESCQYNAIAKINKKILIYQNLCHFCGACSLVCPVDAIIKKQRKIGMIKHGTKNNIAVYYALLETGEGGMSPRLIKQVKENISSGINIIDSPPGTSCPVVETVKDADICVLVTDPTPFGIHDLKLAVNMCRSRWSPY